MTPTRSIRGVPRPNAAGPWWSSEGATTHSPAGQPPAVGCRTGGALRLHDADSCVSLAMGRDYSGPDFAIVRTALSVVIIDGAGLGVGTVGATRALDDPVAVTKRRRRLGILTDGLLTGAALMILFTLRCSGGARRCAPRRTPPTLAR